jgi:hypothetical protein
VSKPHVRTRANRQFGKYLQRCRLPASLRPAVMPPHPGRFAPSTSPRAAGKSEERHRVLCSLPDEREAIQSLHSSWTLRSLASGRPLRAGPVGFSQ